jgi:hypothetical protein
MTAADDRRNPPFATSDLADSMLDRLLDGADLESVELDEQFAALGALVTTLRMPVRPQELAGEHDAVEQFRRCSASIELTRRRRRRRRLWALAAGGGLSLVVATGVAAGTDGLPASILRVAFGVVRGSGPIGPMFVLSADDTDTPPRTGASSTDGVPEPTATTSTSVATPPLPVGGFDLERPQVVVAPIVVAPHAAQAPPSEEVVPVTPAEAADGAGLPATAAAASPPTTVGSGATSEPDLPGGPPRQSPTPSPQPDPAGEPEPGPPDVAPRRSAEHRTAPPPDAPVPVDQPSGPPADRPGPPPGPPGGGEADTAPSHGSAADRGGGPPADVASSGGDQPTGP